MMENIDKDLVYVVNNICVIILWIVSVTFNYYCASKGHLHSNGQVELYL